MSWKKVFFCTICLCIVLELILRFAFKNNPFFSIDAVFEKPVWNIQRLTNFFGAYDNVKELEIYHPWMTQEAPYETTFSLEKQSDCLRILCLGTSSTQGSFVGKGTDVYTSLVEQKLNASSSQANYQVINAGLGGHETFRLSIYYKEVLWRLKPDIIVMYLGGNDHDDGAGPQYHYLYQKMKNIMHTTQHTVSSQQLLLLNLSLRFPSTVMLPLWSCVTRSYVVFGLFSTKNFFIKKLGYIAEPWREQFPDQNYFRISTEAFNTMVDNGLKNKSKIVLIPEIYSDGSFAYPAYAEMMKSKSEQFNDVFYVDIRQTFRQASQEKLFFDYIHFTKAGHALMSEIICDTLHEFGLVKND
ncbi:MAG: SGNH/GDSL hydrolase family protein [Candidatus Omnitrophica bacterium]|nr:SGNH/GDSL hydrolase family protein [Candidatus Omnitrophota bacterium]